MELAVYVYNNNHMIQRQSPKLGLGLGLRGFLYSIAICIYK